MKNIKIIIASFVLAVGLFAGYYFYNQQTIVKNTDSMTKAHATQIKHDTIPFEGSFRWTFFLGPVEQISTHTFTPEYIDYRMTGKVHSTDYRIKQLSYDNSNKKWIGQTPEGLVYILFLKNITKNTVTIYKHKCKQGLSEAISLQRPTNDATTDHGWNVYTREGVVEGTEEFVFEGIFYNDNQSFDLHDDKATWQNKTYQKLTHHLGERRWVGQNDGDYLVIFYEIEKDFTQGYFSIITVSDVKKAYKIKHEQQKLTLYQRK